MSWIELDAACCFAEDCLSECCGDVLFSWRDSSLIVIRPCECSLLAVATGTEYMCAARVFTCLISLPICASGLGGKRADSAALRFDAGLSRGLFESFTRSLKYSVQLNIAVELNHRCLP